MRHANTIQRIAGALALLCMGLFVVVSTAQAQNNEVVVTQNITSNTTWTNDNTYILNGLVFVGPSTEGGQNLDDNVTLTIEPGTVIRGREDANVTTGESGSALIVRRSAQIDASGNADNPIIFTSETDDISDPVDQLDGGDPDRGQWGGLIVLGEASTNQRDGNGDIIYNNQVEGIDPANNPALFGGGSASNEDDQDNSGTLQYVSIRYGGFAIGAGDEVNGLTLGAVGRGTTIDHIEVYANDDDGVEWFGGTVHADHLLTAYVGDDGFDYDQGYRGTGQFWATIHDTDEAGRSGEHDGSDAGTLSDTPYARPVISNATYIGSGQNANPSGDGNNSTLQMRDFAGGEYYNSVFTDAPNIAVNLNDDGTGENYENNDLVFENNAFYGYDAGNTFDDIVNILNSNVTNDFANGQTSSFNGNLISNSIGVQSIDRNQQDATRNLDPRPISEIANQSTTSKSDFLAKTTSGDGNGSVGDGQGGTLSKSEYLDPIQNVGYHGAFDPNEDISSTWAAGWTALSQNRLYEQTPEVVVTQDITSNTTWTNDKTYILNGLVFVGPSTEGGQNLDDNVTLTIEPGTVIRGREDANVTTGESGSALVVRRSAQIDASGTASDPIIFTSETDDISDPVDQLEGGDPDRGQWGGLIVLGEASTNQRDGQGNIIYNNQVEGIDPANNPALFGGGSASNENDQDDSGTLQYVSIRYGGFAIGAGDEVNGLTLGAVGRGTTIDHIEVYANDDDGVEWFGGTVHADHLLTAFVGDDGFDYDQGYRGTGQFWMTIHDTDEAGRGGEHDGSDAGSLSDTPYARPVISNATYIGSGQNANPSGDGNDTAVQMRDFAGGEYYNSVFTDYPDDAVYLNDDGTGDNYENNDLVYENNAFYGFDAGDTFADIVTIANSSVTNDFANGQTSSFNGNLISGSIGVQSIDRDQTDVMRNLDPRPISEIANQSTTDKSNFLAKTTSGDGNGSVGDGQGGTLSKSEYLDPIQNVSYHGAVDPSVDVNDTWAAGWTALFQNRLYLPVEMAGFKVQRDGENFILSWATASETNNAGFDVQRSVNGEPFTTIGIRQGAGTTEQGRSYQFTDANVPFEASTVRYRLRQRDLDGSTELGPTRTVELGDPTDAALLSPFPNPTTRQATVQYKLAEDGPVTLSVYNVLGQRVATLVDGEQSAGRKQHTLDTSSFGSGVYFLRLNTNGEVVTERMTVVR